jgi:hypothetical protein
MLTSHNPRLRAIVTFDELRGYLYANALYKLTDNFKKRDAVRGSFGGNSAFIVDGANGE